MSCSGRKKNRDDSGNREEKGIKSIGNTEEIIRIEKESERENKMSGLKKLFEKQVDERQEMELMKVERTGFWVMYFMLFVYIVVEGILKLNIINPSLGIWVIFMVGSLIIIIGCGRKGLWDYQSRKVPGVKAWLAYSLIAGFGTMILGLIHGLRLPDSDPITVVACMIGFGVPTFVLTFIVFAILGSITKKREEKLEAMSYEEDDDEE